mgnify:CR=1 FL=1
MNLQRRGNHCVVDMGISEPHNGNYLVGALVCCRISPIITQLNLVSICEPGLVSWFKADIIEVGSIP